MRRRALLAASAASGGGGEQSWAYSLHLTTSEWVQEDITSEFAIFEGDFKELVDLTINMVKTLGYKNDYDTYELYDIPEEFDFTIEGLKATTIYYSDAYLNINFGDSEEIITDIYDSMIYCYRFKI